MSDVELYACQGMGRRLEPGVAPALLIVDFVHGFADPGVLGGGNIAEAIAQTQALLGFARRKEAGRWRIPAWSMPPMAAMPASSPSRRPVRWR